MIIISQKLFDDFQKIVLENFLEKKLNEYAGRDPEAYDNIGEDNYRSYIESAINKLSAVSLESEEAADYILNLMDNLGYEFDRDPLWLFLLNINDESAEDKLLELGRRQNEFAHKCLGPERQYYEASIKQFIQLDIKELTDLKSDQNIVNFFQTNYPERLALADEAELLQSFLPMAKDKARLAGFSSPVGTFLTAYAMFLLGAYFDSDPRYQHKFSSQTVFFSSEFDFFNALKRHFKDSLQN